VSNANRPLVGYYVHDRAGPSGRARAIVPRLASRVTILHRPGGDPGIEGTASVELPAPPGGAMPLVDRGDDPVLSPELAGVLARWAEEHQPDLLVVDGPLDVALLGRLVGIPVVPVRRATPAIGPTAGAVHHLASAWLAPFPAALESPDTPPEVQRRTMHAGFVSRFEGRRLGQRAARRRIDVPEEGRHVTIVGGGDGLGMDARALSAAAATASAWTFSVVGPCPNIEVDAPRIRFEGWREDPSAHVVAADVVISGASASTIADVAAIGRPLALVPGTRPDARALADAMEELGAAVVLDGWPDPLAWPALLADLLDHPTRPLRGLADGRAARRAAQWIDAWAASPPAPPAGAMPQLAAAELDLELRPGPEAFPAEAPVHEPSLVVDAELAGAATEAETDR
jgi:UDP-N-acetylglucosamine--N-acetylmuramyl-(pentapeptide) pyrophosphoryl-undecaprenol N-acetylglucosamine transferase